MSSVGTVETRGPDWQKATRHVTIIKAQAEHAGFPRRAMSAYDRQSSDEWDTAAQTESYHTSQHIDDGDELERSSGAPQLWFC